MRVLSIKQPWASMIVRGAKRFEVRSWKTDYRGPLLIHASSAAPSGPQYDDAEDEVEPDDTLLTPSDELARIVGREPLTRQSLVEKVWDYIKKNGLQDAKDPRRINCDSKLKAVIGTDNVRLFDLAGRLVKHVA